MDDRPFECNVTGGDAILATPDMRIIITAVSKSVAPLPLNDPHVARFNPNIMCNTQIAISAITLVIFTIACGTESPDQPTSTLAPESVATATERSKDTLEPGPTQAITTATENPDSTTPPPATEPPAPTEEPVSATVPERDLDIVTLLPFDGIPAIDNPHFFPDLETANMFYNDGELVLGVEIDGDARAYSVPLLSSHEIVNDVVGGKPIAVTW